MPPAHLLLASRHLGAAPGFLERAGVVGRRALVDTTAAEELADRDWIAADLERQLSRLGLVPASAEEADVVVVGGGDPFHLLARLRAAPLPRLDDLPYIGLSAGAIVAGPTLAPVVGTSPFRPPPGLDLTGLGLCDVLVLPHRHRKGRSALHRAAIARFGGSVRMRPLGDREAVEIHHGQETLVSSPSLSAFRTGPRNG